jgi:hypothetical protein
MVLASEPDHDLLNSNIRKARWTNRKLGMGLRTPAFWHDRSADRVGGESIQGNRMKPRGYFAWDDSHLKSSMESGLTGLS